MYVISWDVEQTRYPVVVWSKCLPHQKYSQCVKDYNLQSCRTYIEFFLQFNIEKQGRSFQIFVGQGPMTDV